MAAILEVPEVANTPPYDTLFLCHVWFGSVKRPSGEPLDKIRTGGRRRRKRKITRHSVAPHVAYNPVTLNPEHLGYMLDTPLVFDNNKMFDLLNIFDSQHHAGHSYLLFRNLQFFAIASNSKCRPVGSQL